jgi:hypothetical protein
LRDRLSGDAVDMLFVNAGVAHHNQAPSLAGSSTDDFMQVMVAHNARCTKFSGSAVLCRHDLSYVDRAAKNR